MKLPAAPWQSWPGMDRLLGALGADAGDTRYVGGCVRDTMLGLKVSDVDLATRLTPETVLERLEAARIKAVPTGIAHGTVTAVIGGRPIEVTTLRRDVTTDGRRATVAFTDDWREDAARRDFTINALSADPETLALHDFFGGLADLEARRVRFIGDPVRRIAEDHLRILRFFRFHARFGGAMDEAGLAACTARANDLMALSRERIADELLKLLALPDPAPTVAAMIAAGIFHPVLPEIADAAPLARLIAREGAAATAPDPLRRLAAMLPADPEQAGAVAARLRLSNRAARRIACAAGRNTADAEVPPQLLAYRLGRDEAVDRLLLGAAEPAVAAALAAWERPHFPLTGGALIARGLPAGPVVARTLQAVERAWAEAGCPADPAALDAIAADQVEAALRSMK
jgi:poly(A) polymerase